VARKKEIVQETPNFNSRQFRYYLSRTAYQREWGKGYRKPGFRERLLAFLLRIVPKIGPFKAVDFKIPTPKTEDLYVASVNQTVENYEQLLHDIGAGDLHLTNTDFDTGRDTHAGEYVLSDNSYAHLLHQLAQDKFALLTPELQQNILAFYGDPNAPIATKRKPKDWERTQDELVLLKVQQPAPAVHPGPVIAPSPPLGK